MNNLFKVATILPLVVSMNTAWARFSTADTWPGIQSQPISLNKYTYANANPVMNVDPTGKFATISEFGAASSIQSTLRLATTASIGIGLITLGTSSLNNPSGRRWAIWDIVARNKFVSEMTNVEVTPQTRTRRKRNPNDRHHTIPIYLCGASSQRLSSIERRSHAVLHTGLAQIEVALRSAENKADKYFKLTRRRTNNVLSLADTKSGRGVISNALQGFYQTAGWWGVGTPSIGAVFPNERNEYINGKTSLPGCKR